MADAAQEQIAALIRRFADPPAEQLAAFAGNGRRSLIAKGKPLVELGTTEHPLFFVHSGVVRYFTVVPSTGEDVTKDFSFAPVFATSFGSAVRSQPARIGIAAVTDCVVTQWSFRMLTALYDGDAQWQKFGRRVAEWLYVLKEDRELSFLTQTAEERYAALSTEFPAGIGQVPQNLLASYLGIAPESLSRLKARIDKRVGAGLP